MNGIAAYMAPGLIRSARTSCCPGLCASGPDVAPCCGVAIVVPEFLFFFPLEWIFFFFSPVTVLNVSAAYRSQCRCTMAETGLHGDGVSQRVRERVRVMRLAAGVTTARVCLVLGLYQRRALSTDHSRAELGGSGQAALPRRCWTLPLAARGP